METAGYKCVDIGLAHHGTNSKADIGSTAADAINTGVDGASPAADAIDAGVGNAA